jgi:hypothetical protein
MCGSTASIRIRAKHVDRAGSDVLGAAYLHEAVCWCHLPTGGNMLPDCSQPPPPSPHTEYTTHCATHFRQYAPASPSLGCLNVASSLSTSSKSSGSVCRQTRSYKGVRGKREGEEGEASSLKVTAGRSKPQLINSGLLSALAVPHPTPSSAVLCCAVLRC